MLILGVNYNTDANSGPEAVKQNLQLVKNMSCNSIRLVGSDLEKMKTIAEIASGFGLNIWLCPKKINATPKEFESFLKQFAIFAEELRKKSKGKVVFTIGNKITLELKGFVDGKTFEDRNPALDAYLKIATAPQKELAKFPKVFRAAKEYENRLNRKLNSTLTKLCRAAKSKFKGEITYSKGFWEKVKWSRFDFASGNFYLSGWNRGLMGEILKKDLKSSRKPAVLTEFGTASFKGAANLGKDADPFLLEHPSIQYDEDEQIKGIVEQLRAVGSADLDGCFVWEFFNPDLRSFGITRPLKDGFVEPKRSAGIISEFYSNWAHKAGVSVDPEKVQAKILEQFARR